MINLLLTGRALHRSHILLWTLTVAAILFCSDVCQARNADVATATELSLAPVEEQAVVEHHPVSMADTGMWFVSTHRCPQSFCGRCPQFCPDVARYENCVGYRSSNLHELAAGLEPGVPVCIVIHGSFVDMPSACKEAVSTWKWLRCASMGQRMQMIYLSWPSFRKLSLLAAFDVNQLGRRAARNGFYLADLIQHLPPESPICLIGHSHGTRVAAAGLHLLAGGSVQDMCHPYARANGRMIRTVFTASAIDHDWLNPGHRYDRALFSTQCLLNMRNCRDRALKLYPLRLPLIARRPMGLSGLSRTDRHRLGRRGRKVVDYDVSRAVGPAHLWPYYFSNPGLAMAMRNYVYFPDVVASPQLTTNSSPESAVQ